MVQTHLPVLQQEASFRAERQNFTLVGHSCPQLSFSILNSPCSILNLSRFFTRASDWPLSPLPRHVGTRRVASAQAVSSLYHRRDTSRPRHTTSRPCGISNTPLSPNISAVFLRPFSQNHYLCRRSESLPACRWPQMRGKRKVRATESNPLPNGKKSARACRCRRKQPPSPCVGW